MNKRMTLSQAIEARHSVRSYKPEPLGVDVREALEAQIARVNAEGGLHLQLVCDEPGAFSGALAHYGKFSGVRNYIACVGAKAPDLEERVGYFGEQVVLLAQQLGLNTCWVALTFSRSRCKAQVEQGEQLVIVIALGYGTSQGASHKMRPVSDLCHVEGGMPDWFEAGMKAVRLAPTAMNQQKLLFTLDADGSVFSKATGGFYSKIDLGIARYHFEVGAGRRA